MHYKKGSEVYMATGEKMGTISRIVIDVTTKDVTDLVVDRGGLLDRDEKVVPIALVDVAEEDRIVLQETNQSVDDLPSYETTHYVPVDQKGAPYGNVETSYWYPPISFQTPTAGMVPAVPADRVAKTEVNIPEGRIAISEGAQVLSADDKHIGNVEKVITSPDGNTVTHFVIGKGFLLKEHKLVPAHWVNTMMDEKIHLSVESHLFDRLPDYIPDQDRVS
jgi:uncharacterized protein YrrD